VAVLLLAALLVPLLAVLLVVLLAMPKFVALTVAALPRAQVPPRTKKFDDMVLYELERKESHSCYLVCDYFASIHGHGSTLRFLLPLSQFHYGRLESIDSDLLESTKDGFKQDLKHFSVD
jgi:hypothetical protein